MPINGKLHKVPCVQFSFTDINTLFSKSIELVLTIQWILMAPSVNSYLGRIKYNLLGKRNIEDTQGMLALDKHC